VVLLLLAAPVLLAVALAIRLDSPGPVLFRQARIGRGGRLFTVLKFRTMRHGAPTEAHQRYIAQLATTPQSAGGGLQKLTNDPRVTRVGSFLRRTSLDELPQLVNVVLGQMSVVGPRPALAYELEHYEPEHFERFSVRPGLTGLWQVSGRSAIGFVGMLELDAQYARTSTLWLDLKILARTPIALLRGHAA
jgi:lipopolysaccharide/colanic/teichoic acid biosynthesis glycosyltransferase